MSACPRIETARLLLSAHSTADFDDVAAMWADPAVTRFIGGRASTREESWARLLRYAGLWALVGYGYWAVRERASDRFAGELGFADFHRDTTPALDTPECGWALAGWAQGQGFAGEALAAIHAWADAQGWVGTCCIVQPENARSLRVAERVGYGSAGEICYRGSASILMRRSPAILCRAD